MALVAGQGVEPAEASDGRDGCRRIARNVAQDRISTVDPQDRHARKKSPSDRRDGYRAHLEVEPSAGLNRQCELTMAAGDANHDAAVAARMLATHDEPVCGYGDSAYDTGELRAALAAANCAAVIRRRRSGRRFRRVHHRPLRRGRDGRHLHLPGRITRAITPGRSVNFGIACTGCLLHDRA